MIPLLFGLLFFKKINTKYLKGFFIYSLVLGLFALIALILKLIQVERFWVIINVYFYLFAEFGILLYFFYQIIKSKFFKKILLSLIPIFTSLTILFYLKGLETYPFILEFFIFMIILLYYFYEKLRFVTSYPLLKSISFWLNIGLFIYFTGNFFYLLFVGTSKDPGVIKKLLITATLVNVVKDIILSLAWLAREPNPTENTELRLPDDLHLDDIPLTNQTNNF